MIVKNFSSNNIKDYQYELDRGGKFIVYSYCLSIIFYTFKAPTAIYLVKGRDHSVLQGMCFTLLTFIGG